MKKKAMNQLQGIIGSKDSKERQILLNPTVREEEKARMEKMLLNASSQAPPFMTKCIEKVSCLFPCFAWVGVCCVAFLPMYMRLVQCVWAILSNLPKEEALMVYGLVLCFYGGSYPLTMAAFEALRQCGGQEALDSLSDLYGQFEAAKAASDRDDLVDDDGDGIADVNQLNGKDLTQRKARLVMSATDPAVLNKAFTGVYTAWAAVVAVLKLQFAWMISLASAMGEYLFNLVNMPLTRICIHFFSPDLHKWIPSGIHYCCKTIAIFVAWKIQTVISAFYSGIRGGLYFSRNGLIFLSTKYKFINIDPDNTYIDEIVGWVIAAIGFYTQVMHQFATPAWIVFLLWPLNFIEAGLMWAVNTEGASFSDVHTQFSEKIAMLGVDTQAEVAEVAMNSAMNFAYPN